MSRPIDPNEIPEAVQAEIDNVLHKAMDVRESDPQLYESLLGEFFALSRAESLRQAKQYPGDPPNSTCHHAILKGVVVSNECGFRTHDFTPLFELPHEAVSIWTHTKSNYSCLVSDISEEVHNEPIWRNAGLFMHLAIGLMSSFEQFYDIDYDWIYNFDPSVAVGQCKFLDLDPIDRFSGTVKSVRDIAALAPVMELLLRDERFFIATQNLFASFENHWFCVICALAPLTHRKHPNDELPLWQFGNAIPRMEAAIVQATRSVEAILGKPGKNRDRVLDRWKAAIPLDPNDTFDQRTISLIDYYYELFAVRADAAHSLGNLSIGMSRQLTIDAQSFACIIHHSYFEKNRLSPDEAMRALNFNRALVESEPVNWSTRITADDEYFDTFRQIREQ